MIKLRIKLIKHRVINTLLKEMSFFITSKEVDGYVATPNGSLRKYDYKMGEVVIICDQMPSGKNDPKRLNNISPVLSILATYLNLKFEF